MRIRGEARMYKPFGSDGKRTKIILVIHTVKQFFSDKHGNLVLWQMPNAPLLLWLLFLVIANETTGATSDWFHKASTISLMIWALLELGYGTTPFRRILGACILLLLVANAFI